MGSWAPASRRACHSAHASSSSRISLASPSSDARRSACARRAPAHAKGEGYVPREERYVPHRRARANGRKGFSHCGDVARLCEM
eukprot:1489481-Pleurochrysis_carterae.AAC.1